MTGTTIAMPNYYCVYNLLPKLIIEKINGTALIFKSNDGFSNAIL